MAKKESIANTEEYHDIIRKSLGPRYRLIRRSREVISRLRRFKGKQFSLLDIGTADALMLSALKEKLDLQLAVGVDLSLGLLKKNRNKELSLVQADALHLPFKDNSFDAVTAVAVIEHVGSPKNLLREVFRVLKTGGILILTSPDPFWDSLAERFIYRSCEGGHVETFNLKKLKTYLKRNGFKIVNAEKFMISPIGFPFEQVIERFMKVINFDFFMCNQIVAGKALKSLKK